MGDSRYSDKIGPPAPRSNDRGQRMRERSGKVKAFAGGMIALAFGVCGPYVGKVTRKAAAMTNGPNRILDDFARLMTDAAGAAQGVRREAETAFRAQAERVLNSMDVVQREEFEAVREMAVKAREENARLMERIEMLEAELGNSGKTASKSTAGKASSSGQKATPGANTKK